MIEQRVHELHDSMDGSFVSSIVVSCNLINSSHVDVDDETKTLLTWFSLSSDDTDIWYFVLPTITRDGTRAIIIKIVPGLTLEFDSTKIRHCSTSVRKCNDTKLCGIAFVGRK